MATNFGRPFFSDYGKSLFEMYKNYFFYVTFKVLGKSRNPRWQIQDGRHLENHDIITTSYDVISSRWGSQRKHLSTYYLSLKSHFHSFYTCEVMEGGRKPPPVIIPPTHSPPLPMLENTIEILQSEGTAVFNT